jgi:hypothetical protein
VGSWLAMWHGNVGIVAVLLPDVLVLMLESGYAAVLRWTIVPRETEKKFSGVVSRGTVSLISAVKAKPPKKTL